MTALLDTSVEFFPHFDVFQITVYESKGESKIGVYKKIVFMTKKLQ